MTPAVAAVAAKMVEKRNVFDRFMVCPSVIRKIKEFSNKNYSTANGGRVNKSAHNFYTNQIDFVQATTGFPTMRRKTRRKSRVDS